MFAEPESSWINESGRLMWIFQHSLYDAKGCSRHRGCPYLDFKQVVGRCHRDRSGDQLVVGQGSGGRHLIAKLDHRARVVRGLI